mmetsp:Transcript_22523/g.29472  ORF Transcript_22523/g.29472 Transcript_22523/m.29472 type:complete len:605 (-) Transcript_22523:181-1995(-)
MEHFKSKSMEINSETPGWLLAELGYGIHSSDDELGPVEEEVWDEESNDDLPVVREVVLDLPYPEEVTEAELLASVLEEGVAAGEVNRDRADSLLAVLEYQPEMHPVIKQKMNEILGPAVVEAKLSKLKETWDEQDKVSEPEKRTDFAPSYGTEDDSKILTYVAKKNDDRLSEDKASPAKTVPLTPESGLDLLVDTVGLCDALMDVEDGPVISVEMNNTADESRALSTGVMKTKKIRLLAGTTLKQIKDLENGHPECSLRQNQQSQRSEEDILIADQLQERSPLEREQTQPSFPVDNGEEVEDTPKESLEGDDPPQMERAALSGTESSSVPRDPGWGFCSGSKFLVRGPDYLQSKVKIPSAEPMYDLIAVDFWTTQARKEHIVEELALPWINSFDEPVLEEIPPLLVINCQLPKEESDLLFPKEDGPSNHVVLYFELKEETRRHLSNLEEAPPAVKLLADFARKKQQPKDSKRFKVIGQVENIEKLGLPNFVSGYNGKPVLITKSGTLYHGHGYLEIDINIYMFNFLAKKTLHMLEDQFPQMVFNIALVLEGKKEEELPEAVVGTALLKNIDVKKAAEFPSLSRKGSSLGSFRNYRQDRSHTLPC